MQAQITRLHRLYHERSLLVEDYEQLIQGLMDEPPSQEDGLLSIASTFARGIADQIFHKQVYVRGLIEFSNYCKNDCYYCGLRRSKKVPRYRMNLDEILEACRLGDALGYQTFVLQSGEDPYYTEDLMTKIVSNIRKYFPDTAITLSLGERSIEAYKAWFDAGVNRYLLRHESINESHYSTLHPSEMKLENRITCLENLKSIGYQVGCGFMVGTPGQTARMLAEDLKFIETFDPAMVGVGPFMASSGTPFENEANGDLKLSLFLLSLLRIQKPERLIPATTAIGSLDPFGRERALDAGANVLMPNITPTQYRPNYALYNGKICLEDRAEDCRHCLSKRVENYGYTLSTSRGDYRNEVKIHEI